MNSDSIISEDEEGNMNFIGPDSFIVVGGDYAGYVNEEGCIVFVRILSADGIIQEDEIAIPANPDGTLLLSYDYRIIHNPDGSLSLYVEELSDAPDESGDDQAPADYYELPNGALINPDSVHTLDDGTVYVDGNITGIFTYGDCRTYLIDDQTYAVVTFHKNVYEDEYPYADVIFLQWDNDTDYGNEILIKRDHYRLEDQFLLTSKEFVYDGDGNGKLILVAANGKIFDFYENRYDYIYFAYDSRFQDAYNFPTVEIRYEGDTNRISTHYENTYNDACVLIHYRQIDENGVAYWEVEYADDGSCQIISTDERRPQEGYEIHTEYENGERKVAYQYYLDSRYYKKGTLCKHYFTNDLPTHYDEIDPDGTLISTVFFDEDFNPGRVVYYDKQGNIIKEEN